jgi:hypothetical protein
MRAMVQLQRLKTEVAVPTGDGRAVPLWDLWKYARDNPQLAALAARGVNAVGAAEGLTRCAAVPFFGGRGGGGAELLRERGDGLEQSCLRLPTTNKQGLNTNTPHSKPPYTHKKQ